MTNKKDPGIATKTETSSETSSDQILSLLPTGLLTASRLELARKCPGSFAIGHAQNDSAPAQNGTP